MNNENSKTRHNKRRPVEVAPSTHRRSSQIDSTKALNPFQLLGSFKLLLLFRRKRRRFVEGNRRECRLLRKKLVRLRVKFPAPFANYPARPALTLSGSVIVSLRFSSALGLMPAPVHQMQQYYRLGSLDNCSNKWSAVVDCLTLKTKGSAQAQEILETREKDKPHIWTLRTPEEASSHWRDLYGHLDEVE
ncbi:hypothetical protein F8388_023689 [Cannabis sativa]|uniref:Uncharacterized protein n=1 Tax=Cannabis sativa TaxID=3483 RepID=A0A7J6GA20_CANSA|nr:hypothetical protein F8388_023689 [Cannabis sativa]